VQRTILGSSTKFIISKQGGIKSHKQKWQRGNETDRKNLLQGNMGKWKEKKAEASREI
jgi:hypothetical protein